MKDVHIGFIHVSHPCPPAQPAGPQEANPRGVQLVVGAEGQTEGLMIRDREAGRQAGRKGTQSRLSQLCVRPGGASVAAVSLFNKLCLDLPACSPPQPVPATAAPAKHTRITCTARVHVTLYLCLAGCFQLIRTHRSGPVLYPTSPPAGSVPARNDGPAACDRRWAPLPSGGRGPAQAHRTEPSVDVDSRIATSLRG